MWDSVVDIVSSSVIACFNWFSQFMDAIPGAWGTIFTIFVILVISRFLLGPFLGSYFQGGSDKAADYIVTKGKQIATDRARSTKGLQRISRKR